MSLSSFDKEQETHVAIVFRVCFGYEEDSSLQRPSCRFTSVNLTAQTFLCLRISNEHSCI